MTRAWPSSAAKTLGIDGVAGELQDVPGRPGRDGRRGRPEGLAQPGDVGLERVAGRPWRGLAEHLVDQPVHRDDGAATEQERRQQRPLARSRHREGPAGDPDLERPQDAELDLLRLPGHRGIIASLYASCTRAVGDRGQAAGREGR